MENLIDEKPLISIIVPVYKVEMYLDRCIESIVKQTYANIEIILVDDGSPDNCGAICDKYAKKNKKIKVIHKMNGGLSDARNTGVAISKGKYITFIDSDDAVSDNYIEYLYNLCINNDADISSCYFFRTSEFTPCFVKEQEPQVTVFTGKESCCALFENYYIILVTACWKLYKAEIVKNNPFPCGKTHEDEATTYKFLYSAQKVVIGNEKNYMYYFNPSSITGTENMLYSEDAAWALKSRFDFFVNKNENDLAKKAAYKYIAYLFDNLNSSNEIVVAQLEKFRKEYIFTPYISLKHKVKLCLLPLYK